MRATPAKTGRPSAVRELLLIAVFYTIYRLGRLAVAGKVGEATDNAHELWSLERALRLPNEASFQRLLLDHDTLVQAANVFYATVHFPATIAFLLWTYWRYPAHYLWSRRILTALTAAGLAVHLLVPLAPPRLVASFAMIDTGTLHGQSPYGDPASDTFSNQYAAMPSLHVGWAMVIALGMIAATRGRRRFLWLLHPLTTFAVVVSTANHYWLDGLVALALLAAAVVLIRPPSAGALPGLPVPEPRERPEREPLAPSVLCVPGPDALPELSELSELPEKWRPSQPRPWNRHADKRAKNKPTRRPPDSTGPLSRPRGRRRPI